MKRKLLICSSLITLLLSVFSVPIFAEETVQDSSNLHSLSDGVFLDQYFYDNYDLLPYIYGDGTQSINTDVIASSSLKISLMCSDIKDINAIGYLFGSYSSSENNSLGIQYGVLNDQATIWFYRGSYSFPVMNIPYNINKFCIDRNLVYLNDNLMYTFNDNSFTANKICIFTRGYNANADSNMLISFKLYKMSIYDYSLNDGEGGYVRYYYPAKAKTSGTIGLYDAVNKTFYVSGSSSQFVNPTNEYVENFQISSFLTASLTWIDQIFTAIIDMPIVIIFMAIGLAGAMFRWGRRIVHF